MVCICTRHVYIARCWIIYLCSVFYKNNVVGICMCIGFNAVSVEWGIWGSEFVGYLIIFGIRVY